MEIKQIEYDFSVCKVCDYSQVDLEEEFCFIAKTDEENSLVCISEKVPENTIVHDGGWKAFRIQGTLDFSMIGVLAKLSTLLADHKIGIFAISTYRTDYILTKEENFNKAIKVLLHAGYQVL